MLLDELGMSTGNAVLVLASLLWLLALFGFLGKVLVGLVRWLWTGQKGVTVTVEEDRSATDRGPRLGSPGDGDRV